METHWNTTEVDTMPHRWPADTDFRFWELDVLDRDCTLCGRMIISAIIAIAISTPLKAQSNSSASSITAPILIARARQDQEPRDGGDDRSARLGHRLGRLLLDRASAVRATLVDSPDSSRTDRLLRH